MMIVRLLISSDVHKAVVPYLNIKKCISYVVYSLYIVTSFSIQPGSSSIREDAGTISVCIVLHTLKIEELETNVTINLRVVNNTAGMSVSISRKVVVVLKISVF